VIRVIGYDSEFRKVYSENIPAQPLSVPWTRGSLVVSQSGPAPAPKPQPRTPAAIPRSCELTGRCRHPECTEARAIAARKMYQETGATLQQIGDALGGRSYSTVIYWLREGAA